MDAGLMAPGAPIRKPPARRQGGTGRADVPPGTFALRWIAVALAYYLTARLGLLIPYIGTHVSLVWLPTGVAIAAYLRWGGAMASAVAGAAFAVNVHTGGPPWMGLGIAVGNMLGPWLSVLLLQRWCFDAAFVRRRDLGVYVAAVLTGMVVTASNGTTWLRLAGLLPESMWVGAWASWWVGDAVGALLGGVPLAALSAVSARQTFAGRAGAVNGLLLATVLACASLSLWPGTLEALRFPLLALPLFVTAVLALRAGVLAASLSVLLLSGAVAWGTANGTGPFAGHDMQAGLLALWSYITAQACTSVLICGLAAELLSSQRQQAALFEHAAEAIVVVGPDGRIGSLNPAARALLDLRADEARGRRLADLPRNGGTLAAWLDGLDAQAAPAPADAPPDGLPPALSLVRPDGQLRRVEPQAAHHVDATGRRQTQLLLRDVTERLAAQERVADSERFLRQITDSVPLRIAYVGRDLRYRFVNLAQCQRFGRPRDEVIGRTRSELTQGETDAAVAPHVAAALAGEAQQLELEERVSGELRRTEVRLIPDVDADGRVAGFIVTGIDITARAATERALRELSDIVEHTTDFVVQTDWAGIVTYLNPAARRAVGIGRDVPLGRRHFGEFVTPATQRLFAEVIVPSIRADGVWVGESVALGPGRREIPVSHMVIAHRDEHGHIARVSGVMRDISAEVRSRHDLERQTRTLRIVADAIPASIAVVGADRRYRFVNQAFERWRGLPRDEVIGRSGPEVLGPAEFERRSPLAGQAMAGRVASAVFDYAGADGLAYQELTFIPVRLDSGEVDGFVVVSQDVTQRRREEERLLDLARHDPLTGLLNRAGFEQHLEQLAAGHEDAAAMALLYIDLDRFKPVNDQHGHPVGDRLLKLFARRLSNLVRPVDAVARVGGDEFAIVLANVRDVEIARSVADKVLAAAHAPFHVGHLELRIGASVGVAHGADLAQGWSQLVARADAQLLAAKAAGRGRQSAEAG